MKETKVLLNLHSKDVKGGVLEIKENKGLKMANKIYGSNNEPLKVQVITDVHYYSRKLGVEGKAYDKMESKSQMVIKDSPYVIKRGFDMLCEDKVPILCFSRATPPTMAR